MISTAELTQLEAEAGNMLRRELGPPPDSIQEFWQHAQNFPFVQDALRLALERTGILPGREGAFVSEFAAEHYRAARWAHYGLNIFDLTPSLAAGLLLTEPVRPASIEEMGFPFPVMQFRLPPEERFIPIFERGNVIWADLVRAEYYQSASGSPMVWIAAQKGSLATWRRWSFEDFTANVSEYPYIEVLISDPGFDKGDDATLDSARRLVLNFCSWIHSKGGLAQGAQRTDKGRISKARREHKGAWPIHWIVGRDVKLARQLRDSIEDLVLSRSRKHVRAGWKVRTQHVVRGHWKGRTGRAGLRDMWIQPYMRGPEGDEAWAHLYKAEGEGT